MKPKALLTCFLMVCLSSVSTAQDASSSPIGKQIRVHVIGGANRTGEYLLSAGAGTHDAINAIKAAGGFIPGAGMVVLYRGAPGTRAKAVARYKIKDVLDGTFKNDDLSDRDTICVDYVVFGGFRM